ncbi:major facilitator superfamily domain-containing protein [Ilyonectria destructans]|nr:major facilitator superfamily domain-containing protein [Ilyonectria destructans]
MNDNAKTSVERIECVGDTEEQNHHALAALDGKMEKKLVRKCDKHVLPCITLLFFLSFLDRTNIGNAKIQGLVEDLHMSDRDYNLALFVFFVPYILFEVPSNIIIRKVKPSTWLASIVTLWGIATIGQDLIQDLQGLIAMRFLLGLFEAGLFPGCVYLISMYYKRYELQWRLSLFFSASILAGGFSGLLAFAISNMGGVAGYSAWRWIFILEGILTVLVGAFSKFFIPDWPETAKFLDANERNLVVARVAAGSEDAKMDRLDRRAFRRIASDWKIYLGTLMYFGVVNTGYSGSFFIPTIIRQMGFTATAAQARSVPIFVVAAIIQLTVAYLTDYFRHRYAFTMGGILLSTLGYILLLSQKSAAITAGVQYFALFLTITGGFVTQPITLAWLANNVSGHYKRSVSSAIQIGFGNLGGIVASFVYFEPPYFVSGYGTSLGMLWLCGGCCTGMFLGSLWENKKRDRGERDYRLTQPDSDNLGDDHPTFRFTT